MSCEKFCKGPFNTEFGMRSKGIDKDVEGSMNLDKKKAMIPCPLGCTQNPKTKEARDNIIANNGGLHSICRMNDPISLEKTYIN